LPFTLSLFHLKHLGNKNRYTLFRQLPFSRVAVRNFNPLAESLLSMLSISFHKRPSKSLVSLVLGTFLFTALVPASASNDVALPEIGSAAGGYMTPSQERRLGQAFMRQVRRNMEVVSDPLLKTYIENLGSRLVAASEEVNQPFSFFLVENSTVNAFAGPGGYIGVHTGLILTTESESELAAVIAHEIAHVTQKHLLRTFQMADDMSITAAAVILAAVVLGAATENSDLGMAAATGAQAGMIQRQINFTRANEKEADRVGIRILSGADFDPRAMPAFFERMGKANRFYDIKELPEFLRTHPVTTNRIADSRNRAESYPYKQYPDSIEYHLVRANLREKQFKNPKEAVHFFRSSLSEGRYRSEEGQRYGLVRALIRAREFQSARKELNKLQKKNPSGIHYLALEAELLEKRGQSGKALKVLKDALTLYPNNYPLSIYYSEILLKAGRPADAQRLLEKMKKVRPLDAELYSLLARASADAGQINQGHQYMAEYHYLAGNLQSAAQQLDIALRDKSISYYRSAQMAARLKEIREELAETKGRGRFN
jgi:predicted Zn-dependent protease